jgi:hypothetical protein
VERLLGYLFSTDELAKHRTGAKAKLFKALEVR